MQRLVRVARRAAGSAPVTLAAVSTIAILIASVAMFSTTNQPALVTRAAAPTTQAVSPPTTPPPGPTPTLAPSPQASPGGAGGPIVGSNPPPGSGQWEYAGAGPTFGSGGSVWTYRVAVETGLPVSLAEFTALVDATLGDPRGWTGKGERRFQRVAGAASFTVYLASPWTAYHLCKSVVDIRIGGVPYTNCQAGGPVVINSDRYLKGASAFTGGLDVYRRYAINHEVGHRLGKQHVGCPGAGKLAPVMQQQTLGLNGCQPNAWPFPANPAPPEPPPPVDPPPSADPSPSAEPSPTPESSADPTDDPQEL